MKMTEAKRARGRPPKLSAQAILDASMGLLAHTTLTELSLGRIADSLGVSTMSLYTYFASRDALLEALAAHAFSNLAVPPRGPHWRVNLLAWLWSVQRHFDTHPVVAKTIGWDGRVPSAWRQVNTPVVEELQDLGFEGRRLAFALNWFMSSAIGLMLVELAAPAYRHAEDDIDREALLEFGFRRLVDGIAALKKASP